MPLTVKRRDELEKILESFAKLPELEQVTFPEPDPDHQQTTLAPK